MFINRGQDLANTVETILDKQDKLEQEIASTKKEATDNSTIINLLCEKNLTIDHLLDELKKQQVKMERDLWTALLVTITILGIVTAFTIINASTLFTLRDQPDSYEDTTSSTEYIERTE